MGKDRAAGLGAVIDLVEPLLGSRRRVGRAERLRGGSKKGVYRLYVTDGSTFVLYRWHAEENYWPPSRPGAGEVDPFGDDSSIAFFTASHDALRAASVRLPGIVGLSPEPEHAQFALVEDAPCGTLESLRERDPAGAEASVAALAEQIKSMHAVNASAAGKVAHVRRGQSMSSTPEEFVFRRGLEDLRSASSAIPRLASIRQDVDAELRESRERVRPRSEFGLIHGELGPDHVLLDVALEPILIDIEGAMFFDVEWEHVFLELRFGRDYAQLQEDDLDDARLRLYRLCHYLSLVAGPLQLLEGPFPDRAAMLEIVNSNAERVLRFVRHRQ